MRASCCIIIINYYYYYYYTLFLPKGKVRPADCLQLKAATILPLVRLARSKQDPINRGHGAQYLYRPLPAGAVALRRCMSCACSMQPRMAGCQYGLGKQATYSQSLQSGLDFWSLLLKDDLVHRKHTFNWTRLVRVLSTPRKCLCCCRGPALIRA